MKALLLPFLLSALLSPAIFAQDYAIQLDRPEKPGNEYHYSVTGTLSQSSETSVNGVVKQGMKKDIQVQFEGGKKILEVNAAGEETKLALTVEKFTAVTDGSSAEVFPKGTVITAASVDKKEVYEVDGKPVDESAVNVIGLVVSLSKGGATNDQVFGTTGRKKPGESWDANPDKIKNWLSESSNGIEAGEVSAKFTLDGVENGQATVSGHITGTIKPKMPSTFTVDQGTIEATLKSVLPVDATKTVPDGKHEAVNISFAAHGDTPSGEKITLKVSIMMSRDRNTTAK